MVLHNNKWKRKATKLNNKKHGVSNYKGKKTSETPTLELDDHPEAVRRRELAEAAINPQTQNSASIEEQESDTASEFDFSENGDLDSDDLDDVPTSSRPIAPQPRRDDASRLTAAQGATFQARLSGTNTKSPDPKEIADASEGKSAFARRKLVDNSWRYEEEYFDPYLQKPEEPDDFTDLRAREFELKQVELVPEMRTQSSSIRGTALPMDDAAGFEALRKTQQQEEIARSLKARYGVRKGYEPPAAEAIDEDAFFESLSLQDEPQTREASRPSTTVAGVRQPHQVADRDPQLEGYLDELLGI